MKLDINKFELIKVKNTDNYYKILYDTELLKFWSPRILAPFGMDNEYNKYLLKLEVCDKDNIEHKHLKNIILYIEKLIKKKLNVDDNEFKSIIKERIDKPDLIDCRIKTMKSNITTSIDYEDKDNNYLKTIFDLQKQSYVKVQIEIDSLWDYRTDTKEKNKIGLIVNINKIIVLI